MGKEKLKEVFQKYDYEENEKEMILTDRLDNGMVIEMIFPKVGEGENGVEQFLYHAKKSAIRQFEKFLQNKD